MTLPSKPARTEDITESKRVEKILVDSLEKANGTLPEEVLSDIAQARMSAIKAASKHRAAGSFRFKVTSQLATASDWLRDQLSLHNIKVTAPVAVAVVVAVLVSYNQSNPIPALPAEILSGDVPTEELAMLEELEFASWLAEQQQEGLL